MVSNGAELGPPFLGRSALSQREDLGGSAPSPGEGVGGAQQPSMDAPAEHSWRRPGRAHRATGQASPQTGLVLLRPGASVELGVEAQVVAVLFVASAPVSRADLARTL